MREPCHYDLLTGAKVIIPAGVCEFWQSHLCSHKIAKFIMSINKLRRLPSIETLQNRYTYDPDNGIITRQGKKVGYLHKPTGYIIVTCRLEGQTHIYAHRLAYALFHGTDPYPLEIDHINRDKTDNRIINLRAVDRASQMRNRIVTQSQQSGEIHITWEKSGWRVMVKGVYLGRRKSVEEAIILRDDFLAKM